MISVSRILLINEATQVTTVSIYCSRDDQPHQVTVRATPSMRRWHRAESDHVPGSAHGVWAATHSSPWQKPTSVQLHNIEPQPSFPGFHAGHGRIACVPSPPQTNGR